MIAIEQAVTEQHIFRKPPTASTDVHMMEFVLSSYPWSRDLPGDELMEFAGELGAAIVRWSQTHDPADMQASRDIIEDWRATVESRQNKGLQKALARQNRTYSPWE